jgi:hypothetical protein
MRYRYLWQLLCNLLSHGNEIGPPDQVAIVSARLIGNGVFGLMMELDRFVNVGTPCPTYFPALRFNP